MPETDVIPTSASVASTGKGIRYIGDRCYAYSGEQTISASSREAVLDFTTGSNLIKSRIITSGTIDSAGSSDYGLEIELNELKIYSLTIS